MLIKNQLKGLKKINLTIWGVEGNNFPNGKKSSTMTIYDTTPQEIKKLILNIIKNQENK